MALKAYVDTLDGIDESLHEHYTEKDGGFYLSLDDFGKHPGAVTLKTTLNRVSKERDTLSGEVSELKSRVESLPEDFDPDEWTRLKAKNDGKDDEAIQALNEKHSKAIEALRNKHSAELEEVSAQIAERDSYIDRTLVDGGLKDSLIEVGVMPELMDGALASLRGSVKVQRSEDGSRTAIVETELGDVPVADYVKDWSTTKGKAYLGKPSGPGGEGNNGGTRSTKSTGDLGGNKDSRKKAIEARFPELNQ